MITLKALEENVAIMLNQFRVAVKKISFMRDTSANFLVEDFGLIVCCIDRLDYTQVSNIVTDKFEGWRPVFISTDDDLMEKRDEVLWALMRCGYLKWLRYTFPRQTKSALLGMENLGEKIIRERLNIWNNQPKFKYLIEDNEVALRNGLQRELANDPSFFDYMPEKEV